MTKPKGQRKQFEVVTSKTMVVIKEMRQSG